MRAHLARFPMETMLIPTHSACSCVGESLPPAALEPIAQPRHVSRRRRLRRYLLPPRKREPRKLLRERLPPQHDPVRATRGAPQEPNPGKAPSDACALSPRGSHPGEARSTTMPLAKVPALNSDSGHRDPRRRLGERGGRTEVAEGVDAACAGAESSRGRAGSWGC